ncbi:hypothetical protein BJY04DRAFT_147988 [Aspergillus karnatakaensis]|uniref:Zn(II)2Cys6 transcription factor domain-containing protein n=1 Tax=Aspergillus karnatakaensis TaxID=1810916 RepID=UPI003CCD79B2
MDIKEKSRNIACDRRSACDRCRGQKLRCVRSSSMHAALDKKCERCRKAGADCVNTLARERKVANAARGSSALLPASKYCSSHHIKPVSGDPQAVERPSECSSSVIETSTPRCQACLEGTKTTGNVEPPNRCLQCDHDFDTAPDMRDTSDSSGVMGITCAAENAAFETGIEVDDGPTDYDLELLLNLEAYAEGQQDSGCMIEDPQATPRHHMVMVEAAVGEILAATVKTSTDDILLRLSSLTSEVIADFCRINAVCLSDILSYDSHPTTVACHSDSRNVIGTVMARSQSFLDILELLRGGETFQKSPTNSECSYRETLHDFPFGCLSSNDIPNPRQSPFPDHLLAIQSAPPDMPTTLTILSCYTWLLRTYDMIFTELYISLMPSPQPASQALPTILPGLQIGGFGLDNHQDFQIEILLQLSSRMIWRIESALGLSLASDPASLDTPTYTDGECPQTVIAVGAISAWMGILQHQFTADHGASWRPHMLRQTMRRIQDVLRIKKI